MLYGCWNDFGTELRTKYNDSEMLKSKDRHSSISTSNCFERRVLYWMPLKAMEYILPGCLTHTWEGKIWIHAFPTSKQKVKATNSAGITFMLPVIISCLSGFKFWSFIDDLGSISGHLLVIYVQILVITSNVNLTSLLCVKTLILFFATSPFANPFFFLI